MGELFNLAELASGVASVKGCNNVLMRTIAILCPLLQTVVIFIAAEGSPSLITDPIVSGGDAASVSHPPDPSFSYGFCVFFFAMYLVMIATKDTFDAVYNIFQVPSTRKALCCSRWSDCFGCSATVLLALVQGGGVVIGSGYIFKSGETVDNVLKNGLCLVLILQLDDFIKDWINQSAQQGLIDIERVESGVKDMQKEEETKLCGGYNSLRFALFIILAMLFGGAYFGAFNH